jgi:butyrate kinase
MSNQSNNVLIINPGSTSTKIAISVDGKITESETIAHAAADLKQFTGIWGQFPYRLKLCQEWATTKRVEQCSAVVAMGGLLRPLQGGTYRVNDRMLNNARANLQGEHASNLGCALAFEVATKYQCPAFVVDPVSVDEFELIAFYSGHPKIKRKSLSHALNIHAAARRAAGEMKLSLQESSFVVCHLGGGISIAPVLNGRIIDVNDAASDGPFSPERTGGLPLQAFISICFSGEYKEDELRKFVMGKGGLVAYLGTNSVKEVEERVTKGDQAAKEVFQAMAYQIAKEVGAMSTVLRGNVNAIVVTGGIAHSKMLVEWIRERVQYIAPVLIYPGEDEMLSLAQGVLRVLTGDEQSKEY